METDFEVLRQKLRQGAAIAEPLKRRLWVLGIITKALEADGIRPILIGVEDLIIDRLNGHVHWGWEDDRRWIERLLILHADTVDWAYLEKRAASESTVEALAEIRKEVGASGN